jgi:hypothetical protein
MVHEWCALARCGWRLGGQVQGGVLRVLPQPAKPAMGYDC